MIKMKKKWVKIIAFLSVLMFTTSDVFTLAQGIVLKDISSRETKHHNLAPLLKIQSTDLQNVFISNIEDFGEFHITAAEKIGIYPYPAQVILSGLVNCFLYGTIYFDKELSLGEVEAGFRNGRVMVEVIPLNVSKAGIILGGKELITVVDVLEYGNPLPVWSRRRDRQYTHKEIEDIQKIKGYGFRFEVPAIPLTSGEIEVKLSIKTSYDERTHFIEEVEKIQVADPEFISDKEIDELCERLKKDYLENETFETRVHPLKLLLYYANKAPAGKAAMMLEDIAQRERRLYLAKDLRDFEPSPIASRLINMLLKDEDSLVREEAEITFKIFARKKMVDDGMMHNMRNPTVSLGGFVWRLVRKILAEIDVPETKEIKFKSKAMERSDIINLINKIVVIYKDKEKLEKELIVLKKILDLLKTVEEMETLYWETMSTKKDEEQESIDEFVFDFMKKMQTYVVRIKDILKFLKELPLEQPDFYISRIIKNDLDLKKESYMYIMEKELGSIEAQTNLVTITTGASEVERQDLDVLIRSSIRRSERIIEERYSGKKVEIKWNSPEFPLEALIPKGFESYLTDIFIDAVVRADAEHIEINAQSEEIVGELEPLYSQIKLLIKHDGPKIEEEAIPYLFELYNGKSDFSTSNWRLRKTLGFYGGKVDMRLSPDEKEIIRYRADLKQTLRDGLTKLIDGAMSEKDFIKEMVESIKTITGVEIETGELDKLVNVAIMQKSIAEGQMIWQSKIIGEIRKRVTKIIAEQVVKTLRDGLAELTSNTMSRNQVVEKIREKIKDLTGMEAAADLLEAMVNTVMTRILRNISETILTTYKFKPDDKGPIKGMIIRDILRDGLTELTSNVLSKNEVIEKMTEKIKAETGVKIEPMELANLLKTAMLQADSSETPEIVQARSKIVETVTEFKKKDFSSLTKTLKDNLAELTSGMLPRNEVIKKMAEKIKAITGVEIEYDEIDNLLESPMIEARVDENPIIAQAMEKIIKRSTEVKKWTEYEMELPSVTRFTILKTVIDNLSSTVRIANNQIRQINNLLKDSPQKDKIKTITAYFNILKGMMKDTDRYNKRARELSFFLKDLQKYREKLFEVYEQIAELPYLSDDTGLLYILKKITKKQLQNQMQAISGDKIDETLVSDLVEAINTIAGELENEIKDHPEKKITPQKFVAELYKKMPDLRYERLAELMNLIFAIADNNALAKWSISNVRADEMLELIQQITAQKISKELAADFVLKVSSLAADVLDKEGRRIDAVSLAEKMKENGNNFKDINKQQIVRILEKIIINLDNLKKTASELTQQMMEILASSYLSTETLVIKEVVEDMVGRYLSLFQEMQITYSDTIKKLGEVQIYKADLQILLGLFFNYAAKSQAKRIDIDVYEKHRKLIIEVIAYEPRVETVFNIGLFSEISNITGGSITVTQQPGADKIIFKLSLPVIAGLDKWSCERWDSKKGQVFLAISRKAGALGFPTSYYIGSELAYKRVNVSFAIKTAGYYMLKEGLPERGEEKGRIDLKRIVNKINWDDMEQRNKFINEYLKRCVDYAVEFIDRRMNFIEEPILIDTKRADKAINGMPKIRENIKATFTNINFLKFLHAIANHPDFYNPIENLLWEKRKPIMESGKWNGVTYIIGPRLWKKRPALVQVALVGAAEERAQNIPMGEEFIADFDDFTKQEMPEVDLEAVSVIHISDYGMNVAGIGEKIISLLEKAQREGNIDTNLVKPHSLTPGNETVLAIETAI